jgi:hypothetical protein
MIRSDDELEALVAEQLGDLSEVSNEDLFAKLAFVTDAHEEGGAVLAGMAPDDPHLPTLMAVVDMNFRFRRQIGCAIADRVEAQLAEAGDDLLAGIQSLLEGEG